MTIFRNIDGAQKTISIALPAFLFSAIPVLPGSHKTAMNQNIYNKGFFRQSRELQIARMQLMDELSPELLEERRRGRGKRILLLSALGFVIVIALGVAAFELAGYFLHDYWRKQPTKQLDIKLPVIVGPSDAKVNIEATVPDSGCLDGVVMFLLELHNWCPDQLHIELYSMHKATGQALLRKYNAECATVFINGSRVVKYEQDGVDHQAVLTGSPGDRYEFSDVVQGVKQALIKKYGKAPAILDKLPTADDESQIANVVLYMQDLRASAGSGIPLSDETDATNPKKTDAFSPNKAYDKVIKKLEKH